MRAAHGLVSLDGEQGQDSAWGQKYRELYLQYRDHCCQLDFLPAIASTSGRIHCELLRLLFLHAHRETTRFFEIMDDEHAQPHTSRFIYRRAAFFNTLKSMWQDGTWAGSSCSCSLWFPINT